MATISPASEQLLDLVSARALAKSGEARHIRTAAGLSLADVGGAISVSAATIQRWENGLRKPYGEAALRYGALLAALRDHLIDNERPGKALEVTNPRGTGATDGYLKA